MIEESGSKAFADIPNLILAAGKGSCRHSATDKQPIQKKGEARGGVPHAARAQVQVQKCATVLLDRHVALPDKHARAAL